MAAQCTTAFSSRGGLQPVTTYSNTAGTAFACAPHAASFPSQPGWCQYRWGGFAPQQAHYGSWFQYPGASWPAHNAATRGTSLPRQTPTSTAALAQQLGIQPCEMVHLGWIAEYGLRDDVLPARWTAHVDVASSAVYFSDAVAQQSTWDHPLLPCLRRVVEAARLYLQKPSQHFFEEQLVLVWEHYRQCLAGWHGPILDHEGRPYFVSTHSGATSFCDPRQDTEYMYELEKILLTALSEHLPLLEALPRTEKRLPRSPSVRSPRSPWSPRSPSVRSPRSPEFGSPISDLSKAEPGTQILTLGEVSQPESSELPQTATLCTENSEYFNKLSNMSCHVDTLHDSMTEDLKLQQRNIVQMAEARRSARELSEGRPDTPSKEPKKATDLPGALPSPPPLPPTPTGRTRPVKLPPLPVVPKVTHRNLPPPLPALPVTPRRSDASNKAPPPLPPLPVTPRRSGTSIKTPPPLPCLLASQLKPYRKPKATSPTELR